MDSASLSWKEVIPHLSKQACIYAVELPGYGQSEYKKGVIYSNDFYVQFLKAFMDELQLEKAMVMGLSLGGGIVLDFTLQYPERVSALGLVSSAGLAEKWEWHFITYHFYVATPLNRWSFLMMRNKAFIRMILKAGLIYKPENITNKLVDEIYKEAFTSHFGLAFASWQRSEYMGRKGLRSYLGDRMSEIQVPTLIIHGAHDRTVPVAHAHRIQALIPDAELHVLEEARHWPQKEYPEVFTNIVTSFLDKKNLV